jgi:CHAD domain-containing protein
VQSNVKKAIDTIEKKQTLTNIHLEMEKSLFLLKSHTSSVQNADVYPRAYEQIRDHVGELMARCTAIENPDDYVGHHKMRITAKKLRYVMEICNEVMDDALKPAIKTIKKLQTLLGDMHDCDIWDSEIDRFIEQERQRTIEFYDNARPFSRILPGLEYLKSDRQAERRRLHQQAHELVCTLERDAFWQGLLETLQQTYLQEDAIDKDLNDKQTQPITSTSENTEHRDPV